MNKRRGQWLGWLAAAAIVLAIAAMLIGLSVWCAAAINLLALVAVVLFLLAVNSRQKATAQQFATLIETDAEKHVQAAKTAGRLVKTLEDRAVFSTELLDCIKSVKEIVEKVESTLEDAALVYEDLASLTPSLAEWHDTDGPGINALATEVLSLAQDSEGRIKRIAQAAKDLLQSLTQLQDEFNLRYEAAQEAAQACLAEAETSRAALLEGEEAVAGWGQPAEVIGQAVQVATDLAEQTRILGVNASIEALRSGEAGQGFMLIAEEAERLSDRMQKVAHQIAGQIEDGEKVTVKLNTSFGQARMAIERLSAASFELGQSEPVPGSQVSISPQDVEGLLQLAGKLAANTRMLGGRLHSAIEQLDKNTAEEARTAALRLFDQMNKLSTVMRSFEPKLQDLEVAASKQEESLAEAQKIGEELQKSL